MLLSADVAHNRDNFAHRRVPIFNADEAASRASMDKVEALLRAEGATLWVNHDTAQSEAIPHAPQWITGGGCCQRSLVRGGRRTRRACPTTVPVHSLESILLPG